ncbi:PREDICTED: MAM and LDL-receptor class A domain-containing protein 1-like [Acropora digitifera]|uniref:MAM and LDL-receptor class A domain-containing protein 1-like n=1 Tax=Acropora digitifera TaxID=70779 RepID=UPI00077AE930|nr:PREDICTED: MAM and LDL-receptor class A domain-containing protein 1-like [Acropora digitifera]
MNATSLNMTAFAIAGIIIAAVHCVSALATAKSINATSHSKNATDLQGDRELIFLPGGCNFDADFCNWTNEVKGDDFNWTRRTGKTPSSKTGPMRDRTGKGYYIYIETSWPRRLGDTARMFGGPFSGIRCMRFFYHMYGRHIADLQIFVRELETGVENYVWGRYKNQGKFWRSSNTTVFGKNYTIIFSARVGRSYQGDIAVDDITFVNGTCEEKKLSYVTKLQNMTPHQDMKGEPGTCNFDHGFCEWINLPIGDQFDWEINRGSTGTLQTGPTEDHTGYKGGYIYTEASEPQMLRHRAMLMGPRVCGRMCLQFYYNMYGKRMGSLNVYKREGMQNDDMIWTLSGNQGKDWHEAIVDVGGACYQIIMEGVIGSSYQSDIAVDDIYLSKGTCCQLKHRAFDIASVGNCSFDQGLCQWRNDQNDDFDWQLIEGATPSDETGPTAGYKGVGQYLYVEASEPRCARDRAVLVSGILKGLQCMSFMYHMRGKDTGSLAVYRFGDGVMKSRLWHRRGEQGDMWHEARITLPCNSDSYQLQIEAVIGIWRSDIAIDNIVFTKGACPAYAPTPPPATTRMTTTKPTISPHLLTENSCSFAGHFCSWKNDNKDDFDWLLKRGATTTRETGPSADADGDGGYIYLEASLHISGQKARLVSGPMAGAQCMSFKYHMMGRGIGSLKINQMNEGTLLPKMVWSRVADQGDDWMETRFNLFGTIYTLSIEGERGPSFAGDIAVDSIKFTPGRCMTKGAREEIQATSKLALGICSFDNGFCRWQNEKNDDQFDWSIRQGETPSKGTGPQAGFGGSGKYAFIEASSPRRNGDKAILYIYGTGGSRCLTFAYHMWGEAIGSLAVYQQELGRGLLPLTLWSRNSRQSDRWRQAQVDIKAYPHYKLTIEAVRGKNYRGDIAIDELGFTEGVCGQTNKRKRRL